MGAYGLCLFEPFSLTYVRKRKDYVSSSHSLLHTYIYAEMPLLSQRVAASCVAYRYKPLHHDSRGHTSLPPNPSIIIRPCWGVAGRPRLLFVVGGAGLIPLCGPRNAAKK